VAFGIPGRLVIFRTDAVKKLFDINIRHLVDPSFSEAFLAAGYRIGVAPTCGIATIAAQPLRLSTV
jgi:hypothetical protein